MSNQGEFKRWRKKPSELARDHSAPSKLLRRARNLLQAARYEEGLSLLDSVAVSDAAPVLKAKILSLAGDASAARGKLSPALQAYRRSEEIVSNHPRAWLRPAIAQVKVLLRHARMDEAQELARSLVARSLKEEREFKKLVKSIEREIAQKGQFIVVQRPPRSSVVSTRLGHIFLQEGENESARLLFEKVIEINPKGGCRARLGLAEISLRTRNFVQAEKWATDGLENGKFQAKTLSAWPILISARRNIGKVLLSNTEVARLKTNCKAPVGRRAMQLVVTELRKSNDPLWKTLATDWLQCDGEAISPAIAYCFRRMLASSAENEGRSPQEKLQHAMGMWKTGSLSLLEQISSARAVVSSLLALKSEVTETQFISRAKQDFGKEGGDRMSQAIAELLFRNGYQEKAIAILEGILATTPEGSKRWGRSTWRLAKFQNEMGDNAIAGDLFLRIAEQEKIPARIRNFSLTEALRSAAMAGADDIIQRAKPLLGAALGKIDDPRLLMDISRQLGRTADCAALAMAFRKKGETGAKEAIKTASTPDQAVFWLFHLARRQNDWGDFDGTIALWESMDANRRLWLWSPQTHYWEFLGYVLRAYGWKEKLPEAETLAREFVDDPATPAEGMAILGNSYANVLIYNDRTSEALEVYRRIVTVAPMHGFSSFGYYWLALDSMKRGQTSAASSLATQALACLDERSQLGWILDVRLRSLIIKELAAGITESEILTKFATTFPEEKVKYQLAFIAEDLTRLP